MKTADEWAVMTWPRSNIEHIKQIQLDAIKEGMRRAAKFVGNKGCSNLKCTNERCARNRYLEQEILSASEQLTERDL